MFEEKLVLKILLELAKAEGYSQFSNVSLDGKAQETINKEFGDKCLEKQSGVFEGILFILISFRDVHLLAVEHQGGGEGEVGSKVLGLGLIYLK